MTALVPRRGPLRGYYAATDAKHFGAAGQASAGSVFTAPGIARLNDVVALTARQRPAGLAGDDRDALVAAGAEPDAFLPQVRYLLVRTPGVMQMARTDTLAEDALVEVRRMKPGAPCTLVLAATREPEPVEVGTVIVGPHPSDAGREVVWTAHPGVPVPAAADDWMGQWEGQRVPVALVRQQFGSDVWVNTEPGRT